MLPSKPGDPYYVFLVLIHFPSVPYDEYREVRREMLNACCSIVKLRFPDALDIIGIATEQGQEENRSEDFAYLDARDWSPERDAEAKRLQSELQLMQAGTMFKSVEHEFPVADFTPARSRKSDAFSIPIPQMKGRDRNAPCPCGSGKKYKRCCGP